MGGGDLNLKKSWHPSTLRNIERVWKAEQKHDAEQKKIEQLQKELAEEKAKEDMRQYAENQGVVKRKNDRLDWMYQGPAALVDREQYLMGRRVDNTFEVLDKLENPDQASQEMDINQPGSIFQQSVNVTVDLANKIREDPLFAIRKRETEQMKNLLVNPVKMKQLRDMLQQSVQEKERKKKKKNKKEKKKRRNRDSSDEDEELSRKLKHHEKKAHHEDLKRSQKIHSRGDDDHNHDHRHKPKAYGLILGEKARERANFNSSRQRSRSPIQRKPSNDEKTKRRSRTPPRRKLTTEEMEQRRQEMMSDAKWRKEQCSSNVKRYKEAEEKEAHNSDQNSHKKKESQFYKPMLNKVADSGTVESRVKQKIYSIQRSRAAMNENFARR